MSGFSHKLAAAFASCLLGGCGTHAQPPQALAAAAVTTPSEQLAHLVERYWNEQARSPWDLTAQSMADSLAVERRFLDELQTLAHDSLDEDARLTYELFKRQRQLNVEGYTYPSELLPIDPYAGVPQEFAAAAAATAQHPLRSAADIAAWLRQIDRYVGWERQAVANMREGVRRGYTLPRPVIERFLPIAAQLGQDEAGNVFYIPLRSLSDELRRAAAGPAKNLSDAIALRLLPATRALHDFLQTDYLPRARSGSSLAELPLGEAWYAYRIRRATGTPLSAAQIHAIGVAEVDRLHARLQPASDSPATAEPSAQGQERTLVSAYTQLAGQVAAALPLLFADFPTESLDIRTAPFALAPAASLFYEPGDPAGNQPPALYVQPAAPTSRVDALLMPALLQDALPGRHYQAALQQDLSKLPKFRRYLSEPAFAEGWGLYAASLGTELGLYTDDTAKRAEATLQMRCAAGLAADTGLHALGWSRTQTLDYLQSAAGFDEPDAQALVDGYASRPADALACKLGELRIRALRARAQQTLGERFDLREFHTAVLRDGAVPLDLLETRMVSWMNAVR